MPKFVALAASVSATLQHDEHLKHREGPLKSHQENNLEKNNNSNGIYHDHNAKHDVEKGTTKEHNPNHDEAWRRRHHKKKHHKCTQHAHKKSHHHNEQHPKQVIETTTFNLFGNPTMTPVSFAGWGDFLIIGRHGHDADWYFQQPTEVINVEPNNPVSKPDGSDDTVSKSEGSNVTESKPDESNVPESKPKRPKNPDDVYIYEDGPDKTIKIKLTEPDDEGGVPINIYEVKVHNSTGQVIKTINVPRRFNTTIIPILNLPENEKDYKITIVAVSEHGVKSEPYEENITLHSGSVPPLISEVGIDRIGDNDIVITPPDDLSKGEKVILEVKKDGVWTNVPFKFNEKIRLEADDEVRMHTEGHGGKKSDFVFSNVHDHTITTRLDCPGAHQVAKCQCDAATCVNKSTSCSNDLKACRGLIEKQMCDCSPGYLWKFPTSNECIPQSECASCDDDKVLNCLPCNQESCQIAWNPTEYCQISTDKCTEEPHCNCDNVNGFYLDESTNKCVTKGECVTLMNEECETLMAELLCNNSDCRRTCDNYQTCQTKTSDALSCPNTPVCMCEPTAVWNVVEADDDDPSSTEVCSYEDQACGAPFSIKCAPGEILHCNPNNCTERTIGDIQNNVTYDNCSFNKWEKGGCSKVCICNPGLVRDQTGTCVPINELLASLHYPCKDINSFPKCETQCTQVTCDNYKSYKKINLGCHGTKKLHSFTYYQSLIECTYKQLFCGCLEQNLHYDEKAGKCIPNYKCPSIKY